MFQVCAGRSFERMDRWFETARQVHAPMSARGFVPEDQRSAAAATTALDLKHHFTSYKSLLSGLLTNLIAGRITATTNLAV